MAYCEKYINQSVIERSYQYYGFLSYLQLRWCTLLSQFSCFPLCEAYNTGLTVGKLYVVISQFASPNPVILQKAYTLVISPRGHNAINIHHMMPWCRPIATVWITTISYIGWTIDTDNISQIYTILIYFIRDISRDMSVSVIHNSISFCADTYAQGYTVSNIPIAYKLSLVYINIRFGYERYIQYYIFYRQFPSWCYILWIFFGCMAECEID